MRRVHNGKLAGSVKRGEGRRAGGGELEQARNLRHAHINYVKCADILIYSAYYPYFFVAGEGVG